MQSTREIVFHETTLRDGEQTPGVNFFRHEKLGIAEAVARLLPGCVLDAGFPAISADEREAVRLIAREVTGVQVFCVTRAIRRDIEQAWQTVQDAEAPRLCTTLPVSEILRIHKLGGMSHHDLLRRAVMSVEHAVQCSSGRAKVDFAMEDTTRAEPGFAAEVANAVSEAGARIVFVCDTVGCALPSEMAIWVRNIRTAAPGSAVAVHCHNDLGLATASTLAAVEAGAKVVSSSMNGLGERAGIAATEELIAALWLRRDYYRVHMDASPERIRAVSELVARYSGIEPHAVKPVVGKVAVGVRETGPQVDGIFEDPKTYEGIPPEFLGLAPLPEGLRIIVGKKSSRGAVMRRLRQLGRDATADEALFVFDTVKTRAAEQKRISDEELLLIYDEARARCGSSAVA